MSKIFYCFSTTCKRLLAGRAKNCSTDKQLYLFGSPKTSKALIFLDFTHLHLNPERISLLCNFALSGQHLLQQHDQKWNRQKVVEQPFED